MELILIAFGIYKYFYKSKVIIFIICINLTKSPLIEKLEFIKNYLGLSEKMISSWNSVRRKYQLMRWYLQIKMRISSSSFKTKRWLNQLKNPSLSLSRPKTIRHNFFCNYSRPALAPTSVLTLHFLLFFDF